MFKREPLAAAFKPAIWMGLATSLGVRYNQAADPTGIAAQDPMLIYTLAAGLIATYSVRRYIKVDQDVKNNGPFKRKP